MASLEDLVKVEIKSTPSDHDGDGFVSIWNIASTSCDGDLEMTRALAAQLLGFLCKKNCDFVVASTTDAEYLDEMFERDKKLLYDWNLDSEKVDVLAQHVEVPFQPFVDFLVSEKFNPKTKHSPKRADRVEWFTNQLNVG
jgi:hypothetical protein